MPLHSLQIIDSFDAPELLPYRTMKQQLDALKRRIFIAEGDKVVARLLDSPLGVASVLLPDKRQEEFLPLIDARPDPIRLFVAPMATLERLTGFNLYQGVLAVGMAPDSCSLEHLISRAARPRLLVAADGLSNADNLGGLVRDATAFGAQGLVVGETCIRPYMRRAVRISMGTIFKLPVLESSGLPQTLHSLRAAGIRCIAAHPHTPRLLTQTDLRGDCCLVFGSEGEGLRREVLAACDEAACIPMAAGVDSLNVSNAATVFLYEASRQRNSAQSG